MFLFIYKYSLFHGTFCDYLLYLNFFKNPLLFPEFSLLCNLRKKGVCHLSFGDKMDDCLIVIILVKIVGKTSPLTLIFREGVRLV